MQEFRRPPKQGYLDDAGRLLLVGWEGQDATEPISLIKEVKPAGLIFFARNYPGSPANLRELLAEIKIKSQELMERPLLLAIDHEGGSVMRLSIPETALPSAQELGKMAKSEGYAKVSELMAKAATAIKDLGFNFNLAPVVDVAAPESYIGDRSFGSNPSHVAYMSRLWLEAHQAVGLITCAKHFPGLGSASIDPHKDLPIISRTVQELWEIDGLPYRDLLLRGIPAIMTTHAMYRFLDPTLPATYSSKIMALLKKDYGFKGLVLTDDLEMGALEGIFSLAQSTTNAILAGHDLCLVCRKRENVLDALDGIRKALMDYRILPARFLEAVKRLNVVLKTIDSDFLVKKKKKKITRSVSSR